MHHVFFILGTGIVAGILPGLFKWDKLFSITNIVVGIAGALVGAFPGFGDAPFLLKYFFVHEQTLAIAVLLPFVFIKASVLRKRISP